jgi:putative transposase
MRRLRPLSHPLGLKRSGGHGSFTRLNKGDSDPCFVLEHPWSSHCGNAGTRIDSMLTPHHEYLALGATANVRAAAYQALFKEALPEALVAEIRRHLQQQKAMGTERFQAWVHARTGHFARTRPVGRSPRRFNCP